MVEIMTAGVKASTFTSYAPQKDNGAHPILDLPEEIHSLIEHAILTNRPTDQPLSSDKVTLPINMTSAEIRTLAQTVSRFSQTNKLFHEQCKPLMEELKKQHDGRLNYEAHQAIIDTTHIAYVRKNEGIRKFRAMKLQAMIDAFGGMEKFYKYRILDIGNRIKNDSIDFVVHNDFIGQPFPVMIGKDWFNRPFFSVILLHRNPVNPNDYIQNPQLGIAVNIQNQVGFVATFYQRYSFDTLWTYGHHALGVNLPSWIIDPSLIKDIVEGNHTDLILGNIEAYNRPLA